MSFDRTASATRAGSLSSFPVDLTTVLPGPADHGQSTQDTGECSSGGIGRSLSFMRTPDSHCRASRTLAAISRGTKWRPAAPFRLHRNAALDLI